MKIAISNIAWNSNENSSVIKLLKKFSVDSIEVALPILFNDLFKTNEVEIEKVRDYWNSNGIKIVAVQALLFGKPELLVFDKKVQNQTIEHLERVIYISGKLGASKLVFGSPRNRNVIGHSKIEALEIATEFFTLLAEKSVHNNVVLCIEPNATQYDCNFINNTQEAVELVKRVSHDGFRLHLDSGIMQLNNENVEDSINLAFPYLAHFHLSEPFLEKITNNTVDITTINNTLKSLNYTGYISIEMKKQNDDKSIKNIEDCLKFIKDIF